MKAILKFNLPEESLEHQMALQAPALVSALNALDDWLRSLQKYGEADGLKTDNVTTGHVRDKLWEIINRYDLGVLFK